MTLKELPEASVHVRHTAWVSSSPSLGRIAAIVHKAPYIYFGGNFNRVFNKAETTEYTRNNLFRISDTTFDIDTSWNPNLDDEVMDMTLTPDGANLLVVGSFLNAGGQARSRIAYYDLSDGTLRSKFDNWTTINGPIWTVCVSPSTESVYVGGGFTTINGSNRNRLARFDLATATIDSGWNPGAGNVVRRMRFDATNNQVIVITTSPTTIGGVAGIKIAALGPSTAPVNWFANPRGADVTTDLAISNAQAYVCVRGSGGRTYAYRLTDGNESWWIHSDGDNQGVSIYKGLVYISHHGSNVAAAINHGSDSSPPTTITAVGIYVVNENGVLQPAPWRSRLTFDAADPYTVATSANLKGWYSLGSDAADMFIATGDFAQVRTFDNAQGIHARRVAVFKEVVIEPPPPPPPATGGMYSSTSTTYSDSGVGYSGTAGGAFFISSADPATANEASSKTATGLPTLKSATDVAAGREVSVRTGVSPPSTSLDDPKDRMVAFKIEVRWDGNQPGTRILSNPDGSGYPATNVEFSTIMPGGYNTCSFVIPMAEFDTPDGIKAYRFGAMVTIRIASGPYAGQKVWNGYMKAPAPRPEGTVEIQGSGWKALAEEREEDLLFVDEAYESWTGTGSDPWNENFTKGDSVEGSALEGCLLFAVSKNQDIKSGDIARVGWWFDDHNPVRLEFDIQQANAVPGGAADPLYSLQIEKFDNQTALGSGVHIADFPGKLADGATDHVVVDVNAFQKPAITIGLKALKDVTDVKNRFWVRIRDIRMFELADKYNFTARDILEVLKAPGYLDLKLGSLVSNTMKDGSGLPSMMPMWWSSGTLWELMEYLGTSHAFKVAMWEAVDVAGDQRVETEFRPWETGIVLGGGEFGTDWVCRGYTNTANAIVDLRPSDDVYSDVEVTYRIRGSERLRRKKAKVLVLGPNGNLRNPLGGLPKFRKRTYRYEIQDTQRDGTLATRVANALAFDLGQETYSGTIQCSYVWDLNGNKIPAAMVRAGDRVHVPDFPFHENGDDDYPYGQKTFRIYETNTKEEIVELTVGKLPIRAERLVAMEHRKLARTGTISSSPS